MQSYAFSSKRQGFAWIIRQAHPWECRYQVFFLSHTFAIEIKWLILQSLSLGR